MRKAAVIAGALALVWPCLATAQDMGLDLSGPAPAPADDKGKKPKKGKKEKPPRKDAPKPAEPAVAPGLDLSAPEPTPIAPPPPPPIKLPEPAPAPEPPQADLPQASDDAGIAEARASLQKPSGPINWSAWTFGGTTVLTAAGGIYFGLQSKAAAGKALRATTVSEAQDNDRIAGRDAWIADGAFAAALLSAGASAWFFAFHAPERPGAAKEPSPAAASIAPIPGGAAVAISGSF